MILKLTSMLLGTAMITGLIVPLLPANADQLTPNPTQPQQLAQQPPASTYRPGFWQPTARINPKQAWQLQVVNQGNLSVQYGLSTGENATLTPGQSKTLNNLDLPADLLIYSTAANTALKYTVTTQGNTAIVNVREAAKGTAGNGSLVINPSGAIYIY